MSKAQKADVFLGCGGIDLPKPIGIAKKWRFIKGLAGNNTPAAARPFGKVTACAYSGGYSAGYGNIGTNYGDPLKYIMPENTIRGFSHLHQSGTGFIGAFYNYAVTCPFTEGSAEAAFSPEIMTAEQARPGYYSCVMRSILCELSVSKNAAHHLYTFNDDGGRIAIDFTNDGLLEERTRAEAEDFKVEIVAPDMVKCVVRLHGLLWHFCVKCVGGRASLWEKGCVFEVDSRKARLALGMSPKSMEIAVKGALEAELDFNDVANEAEQAWENAFSAIDIEADSDEDERLFYSMFYHTLIKPCDWSGESFIYDDENAFTSDFATLWDQYKTQFPLLFCLYTDISEKITKTILAYCRAKGFMPHMLLMANRGNDREDKQARMLSEHVLADAMYRNVDMDYAEIARAIRADLLPEKRFTDYKASGVCDDIAHTIDMADGCNCAVKLAERANDIELQKICEALSRKWPAAFDIKTGLLNPESRYYEGNHWNYSFRLMHDMDRRIEIAGGKEAYARLLDHFFGFSLPDGEKAEFEGFNNETDMETPYAYYYADRHDRLCEVLHDGMKSMFCLGRGGIPGNNDSGGLSSMYMWNVMGIFPVSGQDKMLIGMPLLKKTVMHLSNGNDFTIRREGCGKYVSRAVLNGEVLNDFSFGVSQMMSGGELVLYMTGDKA